MSKILAINCSENGSSGGIVTSVLKEAELSGWTSFFSCPLKSKYHNSFQISSSRISRMFSHLISRFFGIDGFCSTRDTKRLINFIEKQKPDIIHLHTLHDYFINVECLFDYLKTTNIAIVWTFHDCWPFTGKCPNFLHNNCDNWKRQCGNCIAKNEYPKSLLRKNVSSLFKKKKKIFLDNKIFIVCPSKWMYDCVSFSIAKEQPRFVIYNGINQSFFNFRKSIKPHLLSKNIYSNKKIIFSMAFPWSKYKKLDTIVSLSEKMIDKKDYLFVVAGASKKIKVRSDNLIFLPRLNTGEVISWLDNSFVFFNPSIEESFGLTNVEAQSRGVPVIIIKDSGGPEETILEGKTGFSVKNNELDQIEKIILQIDNKGKAFFDENCKNNASKFSEKNMVLNYLKLYNSIVAK